MCENILYEYSNVFIYSNVLIKWIQMFEENKNENEEEELHKSFQLHIHLFVEDKSLHSTQLYVWIPS